MDSFWKFVTSVSRILVGLIFMFSGLIKSNDPKGTAIKLNEYFEVFASDFKKTQDTVFINVTDNYGTDTAYEFAISESDTSMNFAVNQSVVNIETFDNEEGGVDSFLGSRL